MRRMWRSIGLFFFAFASLCEADDNNNNNNNDDDGEDYYHKYFEACAESAIEVEDVSLLCDSPGAYYYGNGKYRNSHSCMMGDKGKVSIYFYVGEDLDGVEPFVTLNVKDGSNPDVEEMTLYVDEPMCSIGGLIAEDGQTCPGQGYYYIQGSTYLGNRDGSGESFDAQPEIGFRTDPEVEYFDLGGANTEYCPGDSYGKSSYGKITKEMANAVTAFFVTWGTLLFTVLAVFAVAIFLIRRARRRNDVPFDDADEDLLDGHYNQVIVMSSSRSLVDF